MNDLLTLIEERLAALTKAAASQDEAVATIEESFLNALGGKTATAIGHRLDKARYVLAQKQGRQREAEQIWTLVKAHDDYTKPDSGCGLCGAFVPEGRVTARCDSCLSLHYFHNALTEIMDLPGDKPLISPINRAKRMAKHALNKAPGGNKKDSVKQCI